MRLYTKDDQFRDALKIMLTEHPHGPEFSKEHRGWCELWLRREIDDIEMHVAKKAESLQIRSNRIKGELRKVISGLKRASAAIERVPSRIRVTLKDLDTKRAIRRAELWRSVRPNPRKRSSAKQQVAVAVAHGLLTIFERGPNTTRRGEWHRLSAILYGKPKHDLYNTMLAYQRALYKPVRLGPFGGRGIGRLSNGH